MHKKCREAFGWHNIHITYECTDHTHVLYSRFNEVSLLCIVSVAAVRSIAYIVYRHCCRLIFFSRSLLPLLLLFARSLFIVYAHAIFILLARVRIFCSLFRFSIIYRSSLIYKIFNCVCLDIISLLPLISSVIGTCFYLYSRLSVCCLISYQHFIFWRFSFNFKQICWLFCLYGSHFIHFIKFIALKCTPSYL